MVMFRYSYNATITYKGSIDDNGDLVQGGTDSFMCDYQPSSKDLTITVAGTSIPISYILFVSKDCPVMFSIGDKVKCNGDEGEVSLSVPYRFGKMIYVKG